MKRGEIWLVGLDHGRAQAKGPASGPDRIAGGLQRVTKVPVIVPITSGGNFARAAGFAVSLAGAGIRTTGVSGAISRVGSIWARAVARGWKACLIRSWTRCWQGSHRSSINDNNAPVRSTRRGCRRKVQIEAEVGFDAPTKAVGVQCVEIHRLFVRHPGAPSEKWLGIGTHGMPQFPRAAFDNISYGHADDGRRHRLLERGAEQCAEFPAWRYFDAQEPPRWRAASVCR